MKSKQYPPWTKSYYIIINTMVFKIFKRRKDNSENPLYKWEKQVKKSKRIGKDQMDRFVSSSDMKANFPSYCDPSFVEDRLETTSIGLNRYDENEIDEKGNENDLNDSSDTRQVDNLFSTLTEQERLYMGNQSDEYFPSHADSNEFGYNIQSFNNKNMGRNRSRMVDPSEDVETLGQDGAAVYLYNELLANPVLTCMTLPILPCLGLYVKKIHSDATKSKNLQSEYSEDMERADLSQSQDVSSLFQSIITALVCRCFVMFRLGF